MNSKIILKTIRSDGERKIGVTTETSRNKYNSLNWDLNPLRNSLLKLLMSEYDKTLEHDSFGDCVARKPV